MSATFAGIRTGHSRPCHPQTNGKDGPCHRFLKAEALSGPPFDNLAQAKAALAKWRHLHNTEPPHEALGLAVPIDRYSPRHVAVMKQSKPSTMPPTIPCGVCNNRVLSASRATTTVCQKPSTAKTSPFARPEKLAATKSTSDTSSSNHSTFKPNETKIKSVTPVSEQVLPISPVYTIPQRCGRS